MRGHPGASVAELAAIAGSGKSRALWRLHALAERGAIEKDPEGHWRLAQDAVDALA
jgi:DNA-binding IclR family transcriptional regulator